MNAQDLEQRARKLLAAEYERDGKNGSADHIRTQPLLPNKARAVRAIAAALRQQPAPVVDDARMARALEWVRDATEGDAGCAENLPAIEEAIAAYDPNCGARTVRMVDDTVRVDAERYRWLRNPTSDVGLVIDKVSGEVPYHEGTRTGGYATYEYRAGDELDAAIDAARAQGVQS